MGCHSNGEVGERPTTSAGGGAAHAVMSSTQQKHADFQPDVPERPALAPPSPLQKGLIHQTGFSLVLHP